MATARSIDIMKHYSMLRTVVLVLFALVSVSYAIEMDSENELIGWQGDSFDPQEVFAKATEPYQISEHPKAYVWKNFLSKREAQHIVEMAAPRMKRSLVGGGRQIDTVRTSYGMFIPRFQDQIIAGVEQRLAKWLDIPAVNQEDMQVLRYEPGQRYKQHMDANGRMCTILIYLTDVPIGGETAFPSTTDEHWLDQAYRPEHLSNCAQGHLAVKPEVGTALLFYSMPPGADKNESLREVDQLSMHTGCPPIEGKKWTLTKWVHFDAFRPESYSEEFKTPLPDPGLCLDLSAQCKRWADAGECQKNEPYMVGTLGGEGHCRLSCKNCTHCPEHDNVCLANAREEQGYLGDVEKEIKALFNAPK